MQTFQKYLIAVLRFVFDVPDHPKHHIHHHHHDCECDVHNADNKPTELHGEQYY